MPKGSDYGRSFSLPRCLFMLHVQHIITVVIKYALNLHWQGL